MNEDILLEIARLNRQVELLNERNNSNYEDTLAIEAQLENMDLLLHRTLEYLNVFGSCDGDLVGLVKEIQEITNANWFNNMPKRGMLCWVFDSADTKFVELIKYKKELEDWTNVVPLTNDEITEFLN